jgi:hypothetical protein
VCKVGAVGLCALGCLAGSAACGCGGCGGAAGSGRPSTVSRVPGEDYGFGVPLWCLWLIDGEGSTGSGRLVLCKETIIVGEHILGPEQSSCVLIGSAMDCPGLAASLAVQPLGVAAVEARLAVADPALFKSSG